MALTAYTRVKMFWGALEVESGYTSAYGKDMGTSAVETVGVGIRRAQLVFARTAPTGYSEDVAVMHFDFVNFTSGNPDDTWITSDFTTVEGYLTAWWTAIKGLVSNNASLREIRWYRIGPGIVPPNPAVRVTAVGVAGSGASGVIPPQIAISITNKTGLRKRWGRTYLPDINAVCMALDGRITSSYVDTAASATNTLYTAAAGGDFVPTVYSPTVGAGYAIESVQVDNIFDVIRSRRWDSTTYRKVYP